MKKILSFLLVTALVLTQMLVPAFADAVWEEEYNGPAVVSLSVEATEPLVEKYSGSYEPCDCEDGEYFRYYVGYAELLVNVVYEDGSEENGDVWELEGFCDWYDDQEENHWGLGTHEATFVYRGAECTFEVEVIESPVASVTAVAQKPLMEHWDSYEDYYIDENGEEIYYIWYYVYESEPVFTVTMKDGSVYTGTDEEIYEQLDDWTYLLPNDYSYEWVIGKNTVGMTFMGYEFTYEVEVILNPYKAIEISGEDNLNITFVGFDEKDTYTTRVVDFQGYDSDDGYFEAYLETEDGEYYDAKYYYTLEDEEHFPWDTEVYMEFMGYTTNTLEFNRYRRMEDMMEEFTGAAATYIVGGLSSGSYTFGGYNGADMEMTVDDMVVLSIFYCGDYDYDKWVYRKVNVETAKEYIGQTFGIYDVDVTESKFYNPITRKIDINKEYNYYPNGDMTSTLVKDGDQWIMTAKTYNYYLYDIEITVILNENLQIEGIYYNLVNKIGDANGDGEVSALDARYILQYVAGLKDMYDINTITADLNGDGEVSALDARIVLQMVAGFEVE